MMEAVCCACGATFNPSGEELTYERDGDTFVEHYQREDGTPCGGYGPIVGEWTLNPGREH